MDDIEPQLREWERRGFYREELLDRWRNRRTPFEGIERDTEERRQLMPFPEPPESEQTHGRGYGA